MTEQEIIYSILETIRAYEINDDERTTEAVLRNYLAHYRNEDIKNIFEISEEYYQPIDIEFRKEGEVFVSKFITEKEKLEKENFDQKYPLPGIIYERGRAGIIIDDFTGTVPIVSREEAMNVRRSRMYKPPYIGYILNGAIHILIQDDVLEEMPLASFHLKNILLSREPVLPITAILADPKNGKGYDWKRSPYPLAANRIQPVRKKILREEFGITVEVKKDEVQNARQDNIIYQDESKLYK